ncbi:MAG: PspC domain-containing protein [Balneolaceae bacterium]
MADQVRQKQTSKTGTATLEFDDFELHSTMQDFLKEEEKDTGKGIWNIATVSGMVMLFMAFTFVINFIGVPVGSFLSELSEGLVGSSLLPLIGGALITLVGFGFLVGDRKKARKAKKARRSKHKKNYSDIHGSETSDFAPNAGLRNDLDSSGKSSSKSNSSKLNFDTYGYRHAKRLMKSRSNKKWAGVCGGLAKYFGISPTVVRFIFVAAFFMSWGASLVVYFGLSLAMPKEPIEMMDDFDF